MSEGEKNEILSEYLIQEYDMTPEPSQYTGLCVIFNSCTFKANCLPTRKGSEKDVESIRKVFGDCFGFRVQEMKDKTKAEMESELQNIAKTFRPAWRCFVCFFLSHGIGEDCLVDCHGQNVNIRFLVRLFDGDSCPKMIGKPKLFFAQMCRGFDREEYERSNRAYDTVEECILLADAAPASISADRDRLVCYATTAGRMARMDPEKGSLFIQTLTKVLKQIGGKNSIEEVLSVVTRIVDKKSEPQYKVCPVFETTLVGRLVFKACPKEMNNMLLTHIPPSVYMNGNDRVKEMVDLVRKMAVQP